MENSVCGQDYDKERDPAVIARRTELYNQYVKPYYNMIYKLCMDYSASQDHVRENYTEVLVNFYRRIETYDPTRSIHTWLHIVTKRQVFELERQRQRHNNKDYDNDIDWYGDGVIDESNISGNAMGVDNYRQMYNDEILSVLDEMKPIHRDAIILQEAGYSLKEIAEIEFKKGTLKSKNIDTIKSRLFLARQYLKKNLTRDGERIARTTNNESLEQGCHNDADTSV